MQLECMRSLTLIAGERGLNKTVTKVGILDYEFTRIGSVYNVCWQGEFVLSSFLYAEGDPEAVLSGVKRLHRLKATGLAIRNVFHFEITPEVIRYANQNNFPIFIMNDYELYFEDIIHAFYNLETHLLESDVKEKKLKDILRDRIDDTTAKKYALEINAHFSNTFYAYYVVPINEEGVHQLNHLLLCGIGKELETNGNALMRYKNGAFFIHSVNQSKTKVDVTTYWHECLGLKPDKYQVGISNLQPFLHLMRKALTESYFACCYAKLYGKAQCSFDDIGVYQVLFGISEDRQSKYLEAVVDPILSYDRRTNSALWETIMSYEMNNGNLKDIAQDLCTHENTVRYRMKKIYGLFEKDIHDINFELELMISVKLYRIHELLIGEPDFWG